MSEKRVFPCGCVLCVCPDEWERCGGCGAKNCGQPGTISEHVPGGKPRSIADLIESESALRARVAELEGKLARVCTWTEDDDGNWATECGDVFCFIDGSPAENDQKFCCYCGGNLEAVEYVDPEIDKDPAP